MTTRRTLSRAVEIDSFTLGDLRLMVEETQDFPPYSPVRIEPGHFEGTIIVRISEPIEGEH